MIVIQIIAIIIIAMVLWFVWIMLGMVLEFILELLSNPVNLAAIIVTLALFFKIIDAIRGV